jgi:hypothetical protein
MSAIEPDPPQTKPYPWFSARWIVAAVKGAVK